MISLGSVLRDPYLAVPAFCLPPKSMLRLASASQLCILHQKEERDWGCAPPSLCSPLTWALCEISLWPPAEWSQLLLDNVRTCLYLPTKTCLKHSYKQKFKFENLL